MSTSNKAGPEWESHKATIESLYMKNNLKLEGPGGLMDVMARSQGFAKSKAQYEKYFKQWGMRKYRKKDDWKTIGQKVAVRKRAGKDSDVCLNTEVIPKARVQKQIGRHNFTTTFEQNFPAPSPRTPDGFEIRTPVAEETAPFSPLQDATSSLLFSTTTNDVSFSHQQFASPFMAAGVGIDTSLIPPVQNATPSFPHWMGTDEFSFSPIEDETHYFQFWTYDLPFFQLEDGLYAQVNLPLMPTGAQRPELEVSLGTPLLLEDHRNISHEAIISIHTVLKGVKSLTAVLKALLPSAARVSQAEEELIPNPSNHRSDSAFPELFTLLIYAMANNFADLNRLPMEEIMEYLKCQTNTRLLQYVLCTPGPECEAFAEILFSAAVESEDARIVEILLQKGLNPNELICTVFGNKWTPVECSSMLQNVEITKMLLRAKSDVNKTFEKGLFEVKGALQCSVVGRSWQICLSLELVRMLLDAGGEVEVRLFKSAIQNRDQDLFDLLFDFCAKTKRLDLILSHTKNSFSIPEMVTMEFDNETATREIISIIQAVTDSDHSNSPTFHKDLVSTLDVAAKRGNLKLVQYLLRSHISFTEKTLLSAIRSENKDLVRLLLNVGADVDESSLAGAIRWGDVDIMTLLEDRGAWSRIGEASRSKHGFEAALEAASSVGQLSIVQRLLDCRPPNTEGRYLGNALVAAICANQEAVVLTLLDAGADVNSGGSDTRFRGSALLEALRQKNANIVRSLLDADVDLGYHTTAGVPALVEAAKWGSHSVIEDLISMGADTNAVSEYDGFTALVVSIERKDAKSMQILLNAGADVNNIESRRRGSTALRAAVNNGDNELVEHLLSIGADPDDTQALTQALSQSMLMIKKLLAAFTRRRPYGKRGYGCDALKMAIRKGDFVLVDLLLQAGIDANALVGGTNPLGTAIGAEHVASLAILQRLLNASRNPNSIVRISLNTPYHRETALLAAISTKNIPKVQLLIDAGADLNWPATRGVKRTPLQKAAEMGSLQIAQILIENGALVNARPAQRGGATALQLAAIGGYIGIAELLLDRGADVNAPSAKVHGRTALAGAAEYGRIDMLRVLFNAGAKFDGSEYERAMQLAKDNGHMATRRYLESLSKASDWSLSDL